MKRDKQTEPCTERHKTERVIARERQRTRQTQEKKEERGGQIHKLTDVPVNPLTRSLVFLNLPSVV